MSNEWIRKGRCQGTQLSIRWILGHDRVLGNERADSEAKRAISNGSSPCVDLPCKLQDDELPFSLTMVIGVFKKELRACWKNVWMSSPCQTCLAKIDTKLPSHSYLKATDHLTRAQASVLMQLQMGHIPLNAFLNCIGKADSLHCLTLSE